MRKIIYSVLLIFFCNATFGGPVGYKPAYNVKDIFQSAYFLKNTPGLVNDYNGQPILYFANHDDINVFFTQSGPMYKLTEVDARAAKEAERAKERERERQNKHNKHVDDDAERIILPVHISYVPVRWIGGNPNPRIEEIGKNTGTYSFLAGTPEKDLHSILTSGFKKIVYHDIYPGIDVEYSFPDKGGMKYNLIVHPGADPSQIRMEYTGAKNIKTDAKGNMTIQTASGDIIEHTPVSFSADGKPVASAYEIQGNVVDFRLSAGYNHNSTLTIDPWVDVLTQLTEQNLGCDVDYDVPGNLYVYGAGGANALDTANTDYQKVAKYDITGVLQWVFMGSVASQGWNTTGNVGYNFLSDAKVDRVNEKVYVGCAFNYLTGTQVIRLTSAGVYDNFISTPSANFLEVWSFVQDCFSGDVVALGGGLTSNLNFTVINPTTGIVTTSNFTGIAYGGTVGGNGSGQDIVSGTTDSAQNLYVVMASGSTNAVNNKLYKVNTTYTGVVWGPAATGYTSFSEAENMPIYDRNQAIDGGSSNNFNALAANSSYLYYYDGKHIKAFNLGTGAAVGTAITLTNRALTEGGITVDRCNNVYVGGVGEILTYSFNGTTFTAGTPISLGTGFTSDTVLDVRYNPLNNLVYVTGTRMVGTYTASLSNTCSIVLPFQDSISLNCTGAIVKIYDTTGLTNALFSYVWTDSLGNVVQQTSLGTSLTDTLIAPHSGLYTVQIQFSENCVLSSRSLSVEIVLCNNIQITPNDTICAGQSVTLTASGSPSGGTYHWSPGGQTTASITVTPSVSTTYYVTYTPTAAAPLTDSVRVTVSPLPNPGPNETVSCIDLPGGTVTMGGTGTGVWTIDTALSAGQSTITNPNLGTTTITGFDSAGTYTYKWTILGCSANATVTVTPKPNAGPARTATCVTLPGGSVTMAATGTGTWSAAPGGNPGTATITSPTSPTTTITGFTAAGTYIFVWTNASGCKDSTTVTITAKPAAGATQFVNCYPTVNSATMAGTGTGTWTAAGGNPGTATITSPTSPTTTITNFSTVGTYVFIWTNGSCADSTSVVVSSQPGAGPLQTLTCITLPGGSVTMAASGTGSWSAAGGNPGSATITTPSSPTTTITTFSASGLYVFVWTSPSGCTANDTVIIIAKPMAGPAQFVTCYPTNNSATMAGTGLGLWTAAGGNPGTATITSPTSPTTTITGFSTVGVYSFIWSNGVCADTTTVTVSAQPNAGPLQTDSCVVLSGGSVTMAASGTGTWSPAGGNPGNANITTASSPTTTITNFSAAGMYIFIWTTGGCTANDTVIITASPVAGAPQFVSCFPGNNTATMAGSGTGIWTPSVNNTGTATITSPTSPTTTITGFSGTGVYTFILTNGSCADSTTVTVTAQPDAGPNDTICQNGTALLVATGTGSWSALSSNPGASTITSPSTASTTLTGFGVAGIYGYIWNVNGCTDTAYVLVKPTPILAPTVDNITCINATGGVLANASGPSPFTYQWNTGSTNDSIVTTTQANYSVTVTGSDQCTASAAATVSNLIVTVSATGIPTDVTCNGQNNGSVGLTVTPAGQYTYTWSGTSQTTDTISGLSPGTYAVTVTNPNGCSATAGPFTITQPTLDTLVVAPVDTLITLGDTVQLNSSLTGAYPGASYVWTPSTGLNCDTCLDPVLVPIDTNRDVYTLVVIYNTNCSVTDSAIVTAKPNDLIGIPTAFTPNGDGKNDTFYIPATGVKTFKMNIYNRWGEQVFSTTDINSGWDGTYKGKPEPSEAYMYFFTLVYLDGKTVNHEGSFMLLR